MMILQVISAFFATAAFSVLFYLPKKYILHAGMTGSFGWLIYLLCMEVEGNKVLANFIATLFVAFISHILARKLKTPVIMFLIPGIIPMVPGAGMYHIVQSIMSNTVNMTSYYFFQTMQMAGAIALGIFFVDTLFRMVKKKKN